MRGTVKRKWRPALITVLGGALAGTLAMAFAGLILLRFLGPEIGFRNAAALIALAIAVVTLGFGLLLVRLLLGPMRALAHYASAVRLGKGADTQPPDQFGTREIGATAAAVIDMAEALKTREATIRSYSDHVTHELKGPVSAVIAASELLQDRDLAAADRALVDQIAGAAAQMNVELDALRQVVRAREADYRGACRLADILPDLIAKHPHLSVTATGQDTALPLARDGLSLILDHLLANAAAHDATRVTVTAQPGAIAVSDNGTGIPKGDRARIFEPFFTTRRDTGGTGMGLAIVRSILSAHGGAIAARPSQTGATFQITFAQG